MNMIRRLLLPSLAVCTALAGSAIGASAKTNARDFIGIYRRHLPGKRGTIDVTMNVEPRRRVVIRRMRPNGRTVVTNGTWRVRHGDLIVRTGQGMQEYRLHGSNLERANNSHIFFKKR